jgi:hypothetical protein
VVTPNKTQHYAGINFDLSEGTAFDVVAVPLGGGFGLTDGVEFGLNLNILLAPWVVQNLLANVRMYGRFLIIPDMLALEAALHVPTANTGNLGIEATVPFRCLVGPLEVFGQGRLLYRGAESFDQILIGIAASGLYNIVDDLFVILDVGFGIVPTHVDTIFGDDNWTTDWRLPLAFGAAYRILDDLFVKATFGFRDLAADNPIDQRFLQVTLVQAFDLGGGDVPPVAEDGDGQDEDGWSNGE